MKLATFLDPFGSPHVGAVHSHEKRILDLTAVAARAGRNAQAFRSMLALMAAGRGALDDARELLMKNSDDPEFNQDLGALRLLSPVPVPESIRDFVTFPGHILGAPVALRALAAEIGIPVMHTSGAAATEIPAVFTRQPNYYKGNRFTVIGTNADVERPRDSQFLDYELEFGAFIASDAKNVSPARAGAHIFGYAIFNDFSARDIQVREIGGMTGPCKSKDFDTGNAIGPWIVTPDEISDVYNLSMTSRVNGEVWCSGTSNGMIHSFEEMIAYVSRDEPLRPGEFFGSGTVGGGTGMEINRYLKPGDVMELEVQGLGVLRNRIIESTGS